MIETDLFEFAYVPDWYGQLEQLAEMALPEAWRFRKPQTECKNTDTPILERYLHMMFRKLSIDYNTGETASQKPVKYHFNVVSFFLFRSKQA